MPATIERSPSPVQDPTALLLRAVRANDVAAVLALPNNAEFLDCEPALAGYAVRATQQRPSDVTPRLVPPMRQALLGAARSLPRWPILGAIPAVPCVDEVDDGVSLAWLSHAPWPLLLQRFALGHHTGTLLASGNEWMQLTYLSAAILLGEPMMTEFMLCAARDPNAHDTDGHTPLWSACETNQVDLVRRLLDDGANPNVANTNGDGVALVLDAIAMSCPKILRLLTEHGINFDEKDHSGVTPMAAIFVRRSILRSGPQNLPIMFDLVRAQVTDHSELAHSSNRWSYILMGQIALQFVSMHRAAERLACLQQLAGFSIDLNACAPMYKIDWDALQLNDPQLMGRRPPEVPPLIACLMARRILALGSPDDDSTGTPGEDEGDDDAEVALMRHQFASISKEAARAALLQAVEIFIVAGASPHAQDELTERDSHAWAALFGDTEVQSRLENNDWQTHWSAPEAPEEAAELEGPPTRDWLEDLNMNRQSMRHSYGVTEVSRARGGTPPLMASESDQEGALEALSP